MFRVIKIILINLTILLSLVVLIELIFGYWFKDYNFGPELRGKRMQKIIFNHKNEKTIYLRDFYGFRENHNIYEKYDASKIKIIFNGGSTADEMYLNYNDTIVGNLNSFLIEDNINLKIYNASISGKSLKGHVQEFKSWFQNIPNFRPDIMIYYFGINDRIVRKDRWNDFKLNLNFYEKIFWNITQKSFVWEKIKYVKDTFFFSQRDKYFTDDKKIIEKLERGEFISYDFAKINYKLDNEEQKEIINIYKKNLEKLKDQITLFDIKPIFITQIRYDINGQKILYFLNEELKKFSKNNDYHIIKLDEIITNPLNNSFIDTVHTNKKGSEEISKILYPELKKILVDYYNN
ncbi:SGNH/GDSL hydrolase family protein [Candidatus Pelagibacter sp.]|uniref:SGNH/GDSL hydrolase family protein n=1 Tax=Candidatus Pelagibacter sp. TaxID=2024849 RepID=UPI003F837F50